nr:MAG TPA: hypothetical protein [Bacteriophage sp.]
MCYYISTIFMFSNGGQQVRNCLSCMYLTRHYPIKREQ